MKDDPALPPGRFNEWRHQRPLQVPDDSAIARGMRWERARSLSDEERCAAWYASLLDVRGFEIVLWSDLYSASPLVLDDVTLVPVFTIGECDPFDPNPVVQATRRMHRDGRFLYDGWVPLEEPDAVPRVVAALEERLATITLIGPHFVRWSPKYVPGPREVYYAADPGRMARAEAFARTLAALPSVDKRAVGASVTALASAYRAIDPAARLIFAVIAVQTLDAHLARPPAGSIFRQLAPSKGQDHDFRVLSVLEDGLGPDHPTVTHLLSNPARLRDLRNDLAHGRIDPMEPDARQHVANEARQAAFVARVFIVDRLSRALGLSVDVSSPDQRVTFLQGMGVGVGFEPRPTGVTHMALLYA